MKSPPKHTCTHRLQTNKWSHHITCVWQVMCCVEGGGNFFLQQHENRRCWLIPQISWCVWSGSLSSHNWTVYREEECPYTDEADSYTYFPQCVIARVFGVCFILMSAILSCSLTKFCHIKKKKNQGKNPEQGSRSCAIWDKGQHLLSFFANKLRSHRRPQVYKVNREPQNSVACAGPPWWLLYAR